MDKKLATELGLRIRDAREARGWTRDELADASGVKFGTITDIEMGRSESPGIKAIVNIAAALGTSLDELVLGEGSIEAKIRALPEDSRALVIELLESLAGHFGSH